LVGESKPAQVFFVFWMDVTRRPRVSEDSDYKYLTFSEDELFQMMPIARFENWSLRLVDGEYRWINEEDH
jgi:hypothetical protein